MKKSFPVKNPYYSALSLVRPPYVTPQHSQGIVNSRFRDFDI
jgi:hypothetical protein